MNKQINQLLDALHQISLCSQNSTPSKDECGRLARAAIAAVEAEPARYINFDRDETDTEKIKAFLAELESIDLNALRLKLLEVADQSEAKQKLLGMLDAAPKASPTTGMTIAQRILHVGGRNNAAGYVEFGSIQAVEALVHQVIRDLSAPWTEAREPLALRRYDAGYLNDVGGGDVEWWWDYMRAELDRAHAFYQSQVDSYVAGIGTDGGRQ